MTWMYVICGALVGLVLHRVAGMRCENAIHAIMGMYGAVLVIGILEHRWPWVVYYCAALQISVAVLWMPKEK